ncbi:NAD-dependent protein deacetylase sirtuin-2-like isoform X2 [Mizuhopecten yessoensis]|uniref:NAD-dependent protein deacetylase sirtuin-2 n=1 Tax=Mizuhopecten yessoensis TaxID=6573 RepID=A0A210PPK5_MIZYE|nr:NAD-dependent protein deacetylase sirtuin-2-like isoform X2 [Mizuhopecten yessoensis]OWF38413.1 NAD-dependent protein deacetylase sirtuin-2 [Mizuhopecten yessoensis]
MASNSKDEPHREEETKKPEEDEKEVEERRVWLMDLMKLSLGLAPTPEQLLETLDIDGVVNFIKSEKCKSIVTMAGAGISTSAGIPDFRSPNTGLYHNLEKYNLPHPKAVFDIGYFWKNPEPFFHLAKELWPGVFKPTLCHYFIKMLDDKGLLLRHYTQNIDTLETHAGLDPEKLVEAHGSFRTAHCLICEKEYSKDFIEDKVFAGEVPKCQEPGCEDNVVKPDIVFFGESLPKRFAELSSQDMGKCDLLLVMGTSLVVQPFAALTNRVKHETPRMYMNLEKTGSGPSNPITMLMFGGGFKFDDEDNYRDVFWQGTCDDGCLLLAEKLGWKEELLQIVKEEHAKIDENVKILKAKSERLQGGEQMTKSDGKTVDQSKSAVMNESNPGKSSPGTEKDTPSNAYIQQLSVKQKSSSGKATYGPSVSTSSSSKSTSSSSKSTSSSKV